MDIVNAFMRNPLAYPGVIAVLAFLLGAFVGSFLNVCIARLPLEKSILWPGSRCMRCLQPIAWYDNIPLLGYWRLGGKCRQCGAPFSAGYFGIELLTAVTFAGLYLLVCGKWNVLGLGFLGQGVTVAPAGWAVTPEAGKLVAWLYLVTLMSFLLVAAFVDIARKEIPLMVTIPGTLVGLLFGTLCPWPWPLAAGKLFPGGVEHLTFGGGLGLGGDDIFALPAGVQRWPLWMPLPDWLPLGGWQLGLATAVAGAVAGTLLIRLIRFIFGYGFGKEAMGLGDADLMMMIGAFLGWQAVVVVLIYAVFYGVVFAIYLVILNKGTELAFGPYLALGAATHAVFSWYAQGVQRAFFDPGLLAYVGVLCITLSVVMTLIIRMVRLIGMAT